ncbi:protein PELPK1-like [Pararge aegeria]|uniref:protein PELPK1-like n=1 Tax=Pararge aegeria TaxID=116150 RepID=UPI0019D2D422|nr:protein PELPK1-like [Pararge aegeria]
MLLLQSQPIVPPKIPIWQPSFDVSFMTNGPHTKSSKKPGCPEKEDQKNNNYGDRFPQMTFPTLPQFPPLPAIPALPNFPNFPNFPNIQIPEIKFPEIKMPEIKMPEIKMPDIKIPEIKVPETLDELNSQKGSGFHSSYMVYSSDGSASIIINDEGRIRQITVPAKPKE